MRFFLPNCVINYEYTYDIFKTTLCPSWFMSVVRLGLVYAVFNPEDVVTLMVELISCFEQLE